MPGMYRRLLMELLDSRVSFWLNLHLDLLFWRTAKVIVRLLRLCPWNFKGTNHIHFYSPVSRGSEHIPGLCSAFKCAIGHMYEGTAGSLCGSIAFVISPLHQTFSPPWPSCLSDRAFLASLSSPFVSLYFMHLNSCLFEFLGKEESAPLPHVLLYSLSILSWAWIHFKIIISKPSFFQGPGKSHLSHEAFMTTLPRINSPLISSCLFLDHLLYGLHFKHVIWILLGFKLL